MLDGQGRPVAGGAIALSLFAWSLPLALARDFGTLAGWAEAAPALAGEIGRRLLPAGEAGVMAIMSKAQILALSNLAENFGLPPIGRRASFCHPPAPGMAWSSAARLPDRRQPLSRWPLAARQQIAGGQTDQHLSRYLGLKVPETSIDLRANDVALADAVAPLRIPLGKWPSASGRPLTLAQQAAANLALAGDEQAGLADQRPGRRGPDDVRGDLVAALVIERARLMSEIGNPREVFSHIGKVRSADGFIDRYTVIDTFKGLQIIVATDDPVAPERLAAELTSCTAVDTGRDRLRYFASLAGRLRKDGNEHNSWGLLAVALAGGSHFVRLRRAIWDGEDPGLRDILLAAGDSVGGGGHAGSRSMSRRPAPAAVERSEKRAQTLARWQEAQLAFRAKAQEIREFAWIFSSAGVGRWTSVWTPRWRIPCRPSSSLPKPWPGKRSRCSWSWILKSKRHALAWRRASSRCASMRQPSPRSCAD